MQTGIENINLNQKKKKLGKEPTNFTLENPIVQTHDPNWELLMVMLVVNAIRQIVMCGQQTKIDPSFGLYTIFQWKWWPIQKSNEPGIKT